MVVKVEDPDDEMPGYTLINYLEEKSEKPVCLGQAGFAAHS